MSLSSDGAIIADISRNPSVSPKPTSINNLPEDLLVHILSMVSPEHRCLIRRVSWKWYTLGYHVEPVLVSDTFPLERGMVLFCRLEMSTPYYRHLVKIKVNPLFDSHFNLATMKLKTMESRRDLLQRRSEFLTSPPISMLSIKYHPDKGGAIPRTAAPSVERSDGIRVGDLVEILDKMHPNSANLDNFHFPYHAFHMWFGICERDETEDEFLKSHWHHGNESCDKLVQETENGGMTDAEGEDEKEAGLKAKRSKGGLEANLVEETGDHSSC
jgi:hypothetical protein